MSDTISAMQTNASRPWWQEILAVIVYPLSFLSAIAAFHWASANGYPKWVSAYVPVVLCAAILLPVLERIMPHRLDWRPDWKEWKTDALYAIVIQIAMPPLLALLVVLGLSDLSRPYLHSTYWPHHWPILAQGVLMLLLVDLMRYWLHRFAHSNPTLWRLHAVHHSPHRLYWLNTARFHPLEKALHFTLDSLPFIMLGVHEYVLAFYFVCYAVNGFYQHSNVYLRLGPLNYVFSTAELHRWHHSKILQEANNNYSNTTIIWDLVFGTYYRPHDRRLERTGIKNDHYPMQFGQQMLGPFVRDLENREVMVPSLYESAINYLLGLGFAWIRLTRWRAIKRSAFDVSHAQQSVLQAIVQKNRDTAFGRRHGFAEINSIEDYQRFCPVQTYNSLRSYIEDQENIGNPGVTSEAALYYAKTSGTTGAAKLLPVTPSMFVQIRHQQAMAGFLQYQACPQAFRGTLLGITGPVEEERSASGKRVGAISGVMYEMLPWLMRRKFILPAEIFSIKDHLTKYLLILRLALARKDITYIATANPSTFVLLLELAHEHRDELLASIESGQWPGTRSLPPDVVEAVKLKLRPDRERAIELQELFSAREQLLIRDLWPHVALVATWTGGNCSIPLQMVKSQLPEHAVTMDLGLLASECRVTYAIEADTPSGLPIFTDYFFEFVERHCWNNEQQEFLTLGQLQAGKEYYIFVTTTGGLYRYDMNDIITVTGYWHSVPLIEFLQKGRGVTNITGEKLYEKQVIQATADTAAMCSISIPFFIMLADREAGCYEFYFETGDSATINSQELGHLLDESLSHQNEEYKQKRASGRLKSLRVWCLRPGTATSFRAYSVKCGQREGQFKMQCLVYKEETDFDFQKQLAAEQ